MFALFIIRCVCGVVCLCGCAGVWLRVCRCACVLLPVCMSVIVFVCRIVCLCVWLLFGGLVYAFVLLYACVFVFVVVYLFNCVVGRERLPVVDCLFVWLMCLFGCGFVWLVCCVVCVVCSFVCLFGYVLMYLFGWPSVRVLACCHRVVGWLLVCLRGCSV